MKVKTSAIVSLSIIAALFFAVLPWRAYGLSSVTRAPAEAFLPPSRFAEGWIMKGKAEIFTKETLYKHINGEAELYIPYGFEALAYGLYERADDSKVALAVDIYRMGSLLDAFGIYSNYRSPDTEELKAGAGGFIGDTQLMFYQDRYFVQISASGTETPDRKTFIACAHAVGKRLPPSSGGPTELGLIKASQVVAGSEKYVAVSLLGYRFFRRGLVAEALLGGKSVKVFVVLGDSADSAKQILGQYKGYLKKSGADAKLAKGTSSVITLVAKDPLYKGLVLRQSGPYLFGVGNVDDPEKAMPLLDELSSGRERGVTP